MEGTGEDGQKDLKATLAGRPLGGAVSALPHSLPAFHSICASGPALELAHTKLSGRSVPAGWERSIARGTRASAAMSPSSSAPGDRPTPTATPL
jgi:hypothetical protein